MSRQSGVSPVLVVLAPAMILGVVVAFVDPLFGMLVCGGAVWVGVRWVSRRQKKPAP